MLVYVVRTLERFTCIEHIILSVISYFICVGSLVILYIVMMFYLQLLLREIQKYTPVNHEDHQGLIDALAAMQKVNQKINSLQVRMKLYFSISTFSLLLSLS
tara:strand:+ start:62 stop:367 length:306 start_codon:yes stop_codon:yes gene_type:complete